MAFPNRALIAAPIARDLKAEHGNHWVALVPGVATATHRLWDTLDQDYWTSLADPQLVIFGDLTALRTFIAANPQHTALAQKLLLVARSDSGVSNVNVYLKSVDQMVTGDFWRVIRNDASVVVRNGPMIAGDVRPNGVRGVAWEFAHQWAGDIAATLGN